MELLVALCHNPRNPRSRNSFSEGATFTHSVLTYMARVLRVVWYN